LAGAAFFSVFFSTLGSAFFVVVVAAAAAGLASFFASFTVPEAPTWRVSNDRQVQEVSQRRVDKNALVCRRD
jgi:hypothetical protein